MKYYLRGFGVGVVFVTILFLWIRKPGELTDAQIQSRAAALGMLTSQEAEEKRLSAIQESELKWKDEMEKQKKDYEALLRQKEDGTPAEDGQGKEDGTSAEDDQGKEDGTSAEDSQGKNDGSSAEDGQGKEDGTSAEDSQGKNDGSQGQDGTSDNGTSGDGEDGNEKPDGSNGQKNQTDAAGTSGDGTPGNGEDKTSDNGTSGDGEDGKEENKGEQADQTKPGLVKIEIHPGMHAGQVADLLEESGIIESSGEFLQYLMEQKRQTLIQVGSFEFRQGEEFDVIVDDITGR